MTDIEQNAVSLLDGVTDIIKRYETQWRETGEKYNIFEITGIKDDEKKVCRVLADLLDPHGKHCQGILYLKLFWETVSHKLGDISLDYEKVQVSRERHIAEERRIDIVLEDGNIFVPIEVKIGAPDQPNQVHDYYEFSRTKPGGTCVVYLTLHGDAPKIPDSAKSENEYVTISFANDILPWLEQCREQSAEKAAPVRETLKQFIGAVKSLCGQKEDAEMDEIFRLITKSDDSAKAAAVVGEAMNNLDSKVRELFKGQVLELVPEELHAEYAVEYEVERWYSIYFEVREGKYLLYINYDWNCVGLYAENKDDISSEEGKALRNTIVRLLDADNGGNVVSYPNDIRAAWWINKKTCYPDPAFAAVCADRMVYLCRLYKLYKENPQEVAERIGSIVHELESVKA
jgi:hypothetical protein